MNVKDRQIITGNTYPVRDQLKALGGVWDATRKGWSVPTARAAEATQLVLRAKKFTASSAQGNYRRYSGSAKCRTGGNCSSFGSGRSCGAPDCDGY